MESTTLTATCTPKTSFIHWWRLPTTTCEHDAVPLTVSLCCWWDEKQQPGNDWKQYNVSSLLHGLIYSEKPVSAHPKYFSEQAESDLSAPPLVEQTHLETQNRSWNCKDRPSFHVKHVWSLLLLSKLQLCFCFGLDYLWTEDGPFLLIKICIKTTITLDTKIPPVQHSVPRKKIPKETSNSLFTSNFFLPVIWWSILLYSLFQ